MSVIQLVLIAAGLMALMVIGAMLLTGTSPAKEGQRRLQAVRYRHSESTTAKVESQLKKAIAARKPKMHKIAGSGSRSEALSLRLDRTGKGWTVKQYLYASLGLALAVTVALYIKTGALLLSLGVGVLIGAGLPHKVVGFFVKRRLAKPGSAVYRRDRVFDRLVLLAGHHRLKLRERRVYLRALLGRQ